MFRWEKRRKRAEALEGDPRDNLLVSLIDIWMAIAILVLFRLMLMFSVQLDAVAADATLSDFWRQGLASWEQTYLPDFSLQALFQGLLVCASIWSAWWVVFPPGGSVQNSHVLKLVRVGFVALCLSVSALMTPLLGASAPDTAPDFFGHSELSLETDLSRFSKRASECFQFGPRQKEVCFDVGLIDTLPKQRMPVLIPENCELSWHGGHETLPYLDHLNRCAISGSRIHEEHRWYLMALIGHEINELHIELFELANILNSDLQRGPEFDSPEARLAAAAIRAKTTRLELLEDVFHEEELLLPNHVRLPVHAPYDFVWLADLVDSVQPSRSGKD